MSWWGGQDEVRVSKLITEYGEMTGNDDMLELLEVEDSSKVKAKIDNERIWYRGCMHLAFGVQKIDGVLDKLEKYGGHRCTSVYVSSSGKRWCFCRDPEGNWIELIERGD